MRNLVGTRALLAALLATTLLGACSARKEIFLHSFRERFSVTDEEIRDLQFYTSSEVLAQTEDTGQAPKSILVPEGTKGVATAVGPDRIRVSFRDSSQGVWFCANPDKGRDAYYLATEVDGKPGLHILQDLQPRVFMHEGLRYAVKYGESTTLLASHSDMNGLRNERKTVSGRSQ